MKKTTSIAFFIMILSFIYSVDINYDLDTRDEVKKINNKFDNTRIKNFTLINRLKSKKNYKDFKTKISSKGTSKEMLIFDNEKRVIYNKNIKLKGIGKTSDRERYKNLALNYLKNNFEDTLSDNEVLKILYTGEDSGTILNKESGNEDKSYSFSVKVGRIFQDQPVFNSFAIISIDASNNEIIGIDMKNWISLDEINADSSKLSEENLSKIIADKYNDKNSFRNINLQTVSLKKILIGWAFDNNAVLKPAVVHYSEISGVDSKGKNVSTLKYSSMEIIE